MKKFNNKYKYASARPIPFIPVGTELVEHTGYYPRLWKFACPSKPQFQQAFHEDDLQKLLNEGFIERIKSSSNQWEKSTKKSAVTKLKKNVKSEEKPSKNVLLKEFQKRYKLYEHQGMKGYDSKDIASFVNEKKLKKSADNFFRGQTGMMFESDSEKRMIFMTYEGDVIQFFDRYLPGKMTAEEWD